MKILVTVIAQKVFELPDANEAPYGYNNSLDEEVIQPLEDLGWNVDIEDEQET